MIFLVSKCENFDPFLGPLGPLVLPLVNPPACNENLDHLYTGIYNNIGLFGKTSGEQQYINC